MRHAVEAEQQRQLVDAQQSESGDAPAPPEGGSEGAAAGAAADATADRNTSADGAVRTWRLVARAAAAADERVLLPRVVEVLRAVAPDELELEYVPLRCNNH